MIFQGVSSESDVKISGRQDVYISIEAFCNGFSGLNEKIGFGEDEIQNFKRGLHDLEDQCKGAAKLVSLGYPSEHAEFVMEIYSVDNAGQLALNCDLQRIEYSKNYKLNPLKMSIGFDLDSSDLTTIIRGFEKIFNP